MAINSNKVDRILEQLNESMMRAGEAAANAKPADITVLTQIVDDVHKLDGYYYVYDGSVKFKAYSDNIDYKVGQRVYVLIPQGDYSQQKLIQGRYFQPFDSVEFADEDFNDYYPLAPIKLSKTELALTPTSESAIHPLCTINGNPEINNKQYLALSFKLASNFGQNILRNSYVFGLEVDLKFSSSETTSSETIPDHVTYSLSSRDILGDPYNYLSWHLCRALIELPHYEDENYRIIQVNIAVKEQGPLTTLDGSALPESASFNLKDIEVSFGNKVNKIDDTIIISTLQGTDYDSAQTKESNQKDIYLSWMHSYVDNENKLDAIEFNDNNNPKVDGSTLSYEDFGISDVVISWYQDIEYNANQYMENLQGEINFAENTLFDIVKRWSEANGISNWMPIENNNALSREVRLETTDNSTDVEKWNILTELIDNFRLTDANYSIKQDDNGVSSVKFYSSAVRKIKDALSSIDKNKIKLEQAKKEVDNNNPGQYTDGTRIKRETDYLLTYDPDETRQSCAVWVEMEIIYPDNSSKKLKSNKLEFKNAQQIPNQATVLAAAEATINLTDGSNGIYNLYDPYSNKLYNDLEDKERLMFVSCVDKDGNSILMGQEKIIWQLPNNNTMVQFPEIAQANTENYFVTTINSENEDKAELKDLLKNGNVNLDFKNYTYYGFKDFGGSRYLRYKLIPYLNKDFLNNEIKCYIIKNNIVLTGTITPTFKQHLIPSTRYRLEPSIGKRYTYSNGKMTLANNGSYSFVTDNNNWRKINIDIFDNEGNRLIDLTEPEINGIISLWNTEDGFYSGYEANFGTNQVRKIGTDIYIKENSFNKFRVLKLRMIAPEAEDNGSNIYIGYLPISMKKKVTNGNINFPSYKYKERIFIASEYKKDKEVSDIAKNQKQYLADAKNSIQEKEIAKEIPITFSDIIESLEINGNSFISYDKDNSNPSYFKNAIKVEYNDNVASTELLYYETQRDEMQKQFEYYQQDVDRWASERKTWIPVSYVKALLCLEEKVKMETEINKRKAKITAITDFLKSNNDAWSSDIKLIYEGENNENIDNSETEDIDETDKNNLKSWGPILSYNILRPKSQYIEHSKPNGISIFATISAKINNVNTPVIYLYKPIVLVQNANLVPVSVDGFEGNAIVIGEKKTEIKNGEVSIINASIGGNGGTIPTKIETTNFGMLKVEQKNNKPVYNGLVMGRVISQYPWESNNNNFISALVGYKNNIQTFELNNNGNLYLGTPPTGEGQGGGLRFNGDKAIIEGGYIKEGNILKPGMTIDFNTGSIETQKNMLIKSEGDLSIDSNGKLNIKSGGNLSIAAGGNLDFEYGIGGQFCVKSNTEHIKLNNNGLDIKAKNITLNTNGNFISNTGGNFILTAGSNSSITFGDNDSPTFRVDKAGNLTAESGTIANWKIRKNYLVSPQEETQYVSEVGDQEIPQAGIGTYGQIFLQGLSEEEIIAGYQSANSVAFWAGFTNLKSVGNLDDKYQFNTRNPQFYITYEGKAYSNGIELGPALDQVDSNLTSENISKWNEAFEKRHTHNNLTVLNNLTQSVITNSHTHANKTVLDGIDDTVLVNKKKIKTILAKINELVTEFNNLTGLSMGTLPDSWDNLPETN